MGMVIFSCNMLYHPFSTSWILLNILESFVSKCLLLSPSISTTSPNTSSFFPPFEVLSLFDIPLHPWLLRFLEDTKVSAHCLQENNKGYIFEVHVFLDFFSSRKSGLEMTPFHFHTIALSEISKIFFQKIHRVEMSSRSQ